MWKPNVHSKTFESDVLGRELRFRVSTTALRSIRKAGGIDAYLARSRDLALACPEAVHFKKRIKTALETGTAKADPNGLAEALRTRALAR